MKQRCLLFIFWSILLAAGNIQAQSSINKVFTRQDTLRGTINSERSWWNVMKYSLEVTPDFNSKTISGKNTILYYDNGGHTMQLDLQHPMNIDSIVNAGGKLSFTREGNAFHIAIRDSLKKYKIKPGSRELTIYFSGKPREAKGAPWDGGWLWKKDNNGNPWMSVACQGIGASVWFPCKDHQSDEPDSVSITLIVPDTLVAVSNGRFAGKKSNANGTASYTWEVKSPINNYNIIPYIGKYVNFSEVYEGEKGKLDINYWVIENNLEKAIAHLKPEANQMLKCFEHWFGPYPFYEDGYKLVEAPYVGMEHQSAVAYGNLYMKGYTGRDLSGTGWGMHWDYMVVHESGHEWFGNSITTKDIADMWVHEGFTDYSETLMTQCLSGIEAGNDYVIGLRKGISNSTPLIGPYGVNKKGSGDMYNKGANLIHTIRHVINDDEKFRAILRGLNKTFYHKTVTTKEIEDFINKESNIDFQKVFDQYLRNTAIPVLEYKIEDTQLSYRWTNCVEGFNLPIKIIFNGERWIKPTQNWETLKVSFNHLEKFQVNRNFYIFTKRIDS